MAGVGNLPSPNETQSDVPDSLIGRFIDRLDHMQIKICSGMQNEIDGMHDTLRKHRDEHRSIWQHSLQIAELQGDLKHVQRLPQAPSSVKAAKPMAPPGQPPGSHRGPGTLAPTPSMAQSSGSTFDFDDLELAEMLR